MQSRLVCSFEKGDRLTGYLEKVTHHCSGGPEDHRGRILQDQTEASDGDSKTKRMDKTALGYFVRIGCQVKFTVRVQPGSETTAEIQYYDRQHSGHGPDAQVYFAAVH